jgi:hypothetical protein
LICQIDLLQVDLANPKSADGRADGKNTTFGKKRGVKQFFVEIIYLSDYMQFDLANRFANVTCNILIKQIDFLV